MHPGCVHIGDHGGGDRKAARRANHPHSIDEDRHHGSDSSLQAQGIRGQCAQGAGGQGG